MLNDTMVQFTLYVNSDKQSVGSMISTENSCHRYSLREVNYDFLVGYHHINNL